MRRSNFMFLILGLSIILFGCTTDSWLTPAADEVPVLKGAKKPAPSSTGDIYTDFTFTPFNFWNGTVVIDGITYGITFTSLTSPRNYSSASPFYEEWIIYEEGNIENVYMKGKSKGLVKNAKFPDYVPFHENGKVLEAYGPLEVWAGCSVHIRGVVNYDLSIWDFPISAEGTFRLN